MKLKIQILLATVTVLTGGASASDLTNIEDISSLNGGDINFTDDIDLNGNNLISPGNVDGINLDNPGTALQKNGDQLQVNKDAFVDRDGDTVTGDINMNGNTIDFNAQSNANPPTGVIKDTGYVELVNQEDQDLPNNNQFTLFSDHSEGLQYNDNNGNDRIIASQNYVNNNDDVEDDQDLDEVLSDGTDASGKHIDVDAVEVDSDSDYSKLYVYGGQAGANDDEYSIGMHNNMGYGPLNDWATTFTMNDDNDRGWVFRDTGMGTGNAAMALDTQGNMRLNGALNLDNNNINNIGGLQNCNDNQFVDGNGNCETDDDKPGTDDFGNADDLDSSGSLQTDTVADNEIKDNTVDSSEIQNGATFSMDALRSVSDQNAIRFENGDSRITNHDGHGNFNIRTGTDNSNNIVAGTGGTHIRMDESGGVDIEVDESTGTGNTMGEDIGLSVNGGSVDIRDGNLDMNSNEITSLSDPTDPQDAATRSYVNSNDDTIQDNQGLEEVLSLDNRVGGENINFNETSNIQASGTNAITLDNNQNIGIPNGNLDIGNTAFTGGALDVGGEANIDGNLDLNSYNSITWNDGGRWSIKDDQSTNNLMFQEKIGDNTFPVVSFKNGGNVEIPNGNLNLGNNDIDDIASVDGGGDAIQVKSQVQLNNNQIKDFDQLVTGRGGRVVTFNNPSGGSSEMRFRSGENSGSDYGYIKAIDDENNNGENFGLTLGTENDDASSSNDHITLRPAGDLYLRPGDAGSGETTNFGNLNMNNNNIDNVETLGSDRSTNINLVDGGDVGIPNGDLDLGTNTLTNTDRIVFSNNPQIGSGSTASDSSATALGTSSTASGISATAIGTLSTASATDATALGDDSTASGDQATAIGPGSTASGLDTTALGSGSTASGTSATAIGKGSTASEYATALGTSSTASAQLATALGIGSTASDLTATALGANSQASAQDAVAIGRQANAPNPNEATFGSNTNRLNANITGSLTVHQNTDLKGNLNINNNNINNIGGLQNCGSDEFVNGNGDCTADSFQADNQGLPDVLNNDDSANQDINLGTDNAILTNGGNDDNHGIAQGDGSSGYTGHDGPDVFGYDGVNVYGTNTGQTIARFEDNGNVEIPNGDLDLGTNTLTNTDRIVFSNNPQIGSGSTASDSSATALGTSSTASGISATAIGDGSTASGNDDVAIGESSTASGTEFQSGAVALGSKSTASANSAIAIGRSSTASASDATALGQFSTASAGNAVAIGYQANAPNPNEATFGAFGTNFEGDSLRLDVNITGDLTVHQKTDLRGNLNMNNNRIKQANSVELPGAFGDVKVDTRPEILRKFTQCGKQAKSLQISSTAKFVLKGAGGGSGHRGGDGGRGGAINVSYKPSGTETIDIYVGCEGGDGGGFNSPGGDGGDGRNLGGDGGDNEFGGGGGGGSTAVVGPDGFLIAVAGGGGGGGGSLNSLDGGGGGGAPGGTGGTGGGSSGEDGSGVRTEGGDGGNAGSNPGQDGQEAAAQGTILGQGTGNSGDGAVKVLRQTQTINGRNVVTSDNEGTSLVERIKFKSSPQVGQGSTASSQDATALGQSSEASGQDATALGESSQAFSQDATALGESSQAISQDATALGESSTASSSRATALGESSQAISQDATALGQSSEASGTSATAIGISSTASSSSATAIGTSSTASQQQATAIGTSSTASSSDATALGKSSTASDTSATALGESSEASKQQATAIGTSSTASGISATALGTTTTASGNGATALGKRSTVSSNRATAIGQSSTASAENAVAIGFNANAPNPREATFGAFDTDFEGKSNRIDVNITGDLTVHQSLSRGGVWSSYLSSTQTNAENGKRVNVFENVNVGGNSKAYSKTSDSTLKTLQQGVYKISYQVNVHRTGSGGRNVMQSFVRVNGNNQIDKTATACYIRTDGNGDECTNSASVMLNLNNGDEIDIFTREERGSESGNNIEHARINIEFIQ